MYPVLFRIGPLTIYSYGLMVALGFLAGIGIAIWLAKREKIATEKILDLAVYVLIASVVGARLFYVIEFWPEFITNPLNVFFVWQGGLVFYGGLLLAVITILIYAQASKINVWKLLDIIAPATALGYAIGRIGCFLNGCCYGIECSLPWAVSFPNLAGLRHPTQIYASLTGLLIFGLLMVLWRFRKFEGQVFCAGLTMYGIYRFSIEFVRVNPRYILGLSMAQWGSILLVIIGLSIYYILSTRKAA